VDNAHPDVDGIWFKESDLPYTRLSRCQAFLAALGSMATGGAPPMPERIAADLLPKVCAAVSAI
jgi:hypothetical protein